jgi:hypothetical protein
MLGLTALLGFIATVPLANWLIGNVGTVCVPQGPCLIPVGFGLTAPSGVLVIGAAFVLRDLVQRELGRGWALAAIFVGGCLSAALAPPALVVASLASFLLSELADFAVYTPLARRRFLVAVVASSVVGLALDSALFLWLAFGSLGYLPGQIVGKLWAVIAGTVCVALLRRPPGCSRAVGLTLRG